MDSHVWQVSDIQALKAVDTGDDASDQDKAGLAVKWQVGAHQVAVRWAIWAMKPAVAITIHLSSSPCVPN